MGIPIGQQYTATVTARGAKATQCEKCKTPYAYQVERTASGSGTSLLWLDNAGAEDRAASAARQSASDALDRAVDAVACPKCGWFQADMVSEVKWNWGCGMWLGLVAVAICASLVDVFWGATTLYTRWPWMLGGSALLGILTYMATNPNNGYHEVHGHSQRALGSRGVVLEDSRSDDELQTELYDCLRAAMLSMAGIDGVIDPEELAAVARIYEQVTDKPVQVADLEREGRAAMGRHQATLESLAKLAPYLQFQGKAMFIRAVLVIASADGHIDDSEWKLLAAIGAALEMDAGQVKSVVEEMAG